MSAFCLGRMRGPQMTNPLLLLLLLLSSLTGTVLCQYEEDGTDPEAVTEEGVTDDPGPDDGTEISEPPPTTPTTDDGSSATSGSTAESESTVPTSTPNDDEEGLSPIIIILIPVVFVVIIIGMIVCGIFINRRWNQQARNQELRKQDPDLDGSSTEKVPMPMFEEDVPSVLELEMEELGQWMKKDDEAAEESIPA